VEREKKEVKGINNRKIKMEIKYWKKLGDGGGVREREKAHKQAGQCATVPTLSLCYCL